MARFVQGAGQIGFTAMLPKLSKMILSYVENAKDGEGIRDQM